MIKKIFENELFCFFLILAIGVFLRFWNITSWQHLTYDQSRDYLILKRLLIDHKFFLVGPTVSIVPGFFLPPFYYYSLIPFLWLADFLIVGPDIYTAILGTVSIVVFYFLAKDLFGKIPALVSSFAYSLNPYLVQTSRHAWNPNSLFLFTLLFFLAFEKIVFKKERKWFYLAGFSLGWAIGLHLNAFVFLPFFIYLIVWEIKNKKIDKALLGGTALFLVIFLPLVVFDLKHSFPVSKAAISFLKGKTTTDSSFAPRIKEIGRDWYKMPAVLISGAFQKENMTVRPSNITAFSRVDIFSQKGFNSQLLIFLSLFLWLFSLFILLSKKDKQGLFLALFLTAGLLIRFCFPGNLFYFYYYLGVFPFVFLILAKTIYEEKEKPFGKFLIALIILISVFSWVNFGFFNDPKTEAWFLPASKILAQDASQETVAIANNVGDKSRWEHNGLEYRYFSEALFGLKSLGWEADDYRRANVLYFIDEGNVPDPLKFGGMEVEAFKPSIIEQVWEIGTGQKVYKMTR